MFRMTQGTDAMVLSLMASMGKVCIAARSATRRNSEWNHTVQRWHFDALFETSDQIALNVVVVVGRGNANHACSTRAL